MKVCKKANERLTQMLIKEKEAQDLLDYTERGICPKCGENLREIDCDEVGHFKECTKCEFNTK